MNYVDAVNKKSVMSMTIAGSLVVLLVGCGGIVDDDTSSGSCGLLTDEDVNGGVTLEAGSCYRVEDRLTVSQGTLTLEAGVEISFDEHVGLRIRDDGRLVADASGGDAIVFDGYQSVNSGNGHWRGIQFVDSFSDTNKMDNVIINDAGSTGWTSIAPSAALYLQGSQVDVSNIAITNSSQHGIEVVHGSILTGCQDLSFDGITNGEDINTNRTNKENVCDGTWFDE